MSYCSNCSHQINTNDKFCSRCGTKVDRTNSGKSEIEDMQTYKFSSSILRGGNLITPDRIIITADSVTYKKRNSYLISVDSISIPLNKIASIEIDKGLIDADIIIKGFGQSNIRARNFAKSDARKIKEIIESRINS